MCGLILTPDPTILPEAVHRLVQLRGVYPLRWQRCSMLWMGHALLPLHGHAPQPFRGRGCGMLVGEVYNWRDLSTDAAVRNDAEAVFRLLDKTPWEVLADPFRLGRLISHWQGQFVLVYMRDERLLALRSWPGTIMLARHPPSGSLASLLPGGWREVHPRHVLYGRLRAKRILWEEAYLPWSFPLSSASFLDTVRAAVKRMLEHTPRVAIALGGKDSVLLAVLAAELGFQPLLLHVAVEGREDPDRTLHDALSRVTGLDVQHMRIPHQDVLRAARLLTRMVEPHTIKVSSALPLFFAAREARRRGVHVLMTGSGADEILAAYARSRRMPASQWLSESMALLLTFWERNGWREDAAVSFWQVEARQPFLERDVIAAAWQEGSQDPVALREKQPIAAFLAARGLPVPPKRAAQYSSGMLRVLQRAARTSGMRRPSMLLQDWTLRRRRAIALVSGGKDGFMAFLLARRHGYAVPAWLTLQAPEGSWLYHTPLTGLVGGMARAVGVRHYVYPVPAEDVNVEERVLARALRELRERENADVLIVGALASLFQRDRMLRAAEEAGMSLYAPFWQVDVQEYLHMLLDEGVEALIVRTAAEGLGRRHVGRVLDKTLIDEFVRRGVHPAGEGGEYETLVIDSPLHTRRLVLDAFRIEEDAGMHTLVPTAYRWIDKQRDALLEDDAEE